jgi:FAD/FMN-containing dehydrogenase
MIEAQRIACRNDAWVVMTFAAKSAGLITAATGDMAIGQSQVIDLAYYPFREGVEFWPDVRVAADIRPSPPPLPPGIVFKMNGRTAYYKVSGFTFNWTVAFDKLGEPSGRPALPGFPEDIPLNVLPYCNWDQTIQAPGVLTCAPKSQEDVASVCNWAKANSFQVRPRGVMHNWSPFTLPPNPTANAKVMLVDLTKSLWHSTFLPASDGMPNRVKVETGKTMLELMEYLESVEGGSGPAPGYSFPHIPAPGNLTVGGVLAIDAHGTAVPTPPKDAFAASYGSMSNQILEFVAVVTDPDSPASGTYFTRTFKRGENDAKALLTHVGRAFLVEATLEVVDNYNLRCQSFTDIPWQTLFAPPAGPESGKRFADFLSRDGRVEIIWFAFSENPWVHVWSVEPAQPVGALKVDKPYNYPFADNVPEALQKFIRLILEGIPSVTPDLGRASALVTANGLDGKNILGFPDKSYQPPSRDIWGSSKNSLIYIQDTTLKVTANGYAIQMKKADVQQAVSDFAFQFDAMLKAYSAPGREQYPINSPLEIRVTSLDDPSQVGGGNAESPVISALSQDALAEQKGWDVALWLDILTIPGTPHSSEFYTELENWILQRFSGDAGRTMPEWSKGWGYTAEGGPWTSAGFFEHIRQAFTDGRTDKNNWKYEVDTLKGYDQSNLFSNPLLDQLFKTP